MPWTYSQSTGQLTRNGAAVDQAGYSGAPAGRNNPNMQQVPDVGPIPRGRYRIGAPRSSADHGPHVLDLAPEGHNALGRTDFLVHGERRTGPPGNASRGCIILPLTVRRQISASGDRELIVVE
jgi:Protein of unknown function (DUF2778)